MITRKGKKKKVLSVYECTYERARTPEQKREIIERLLKAWSSIYDQRFLQFLCNYGPGGDPFYPEDYDMINIIEWNLKRKQS